VGAVSSVVRAAQGSGGRKRPAGAGRPPRPAGRLAALAAIGVMASLLTAVRTGAGGYGENPAGGWIDAHFLRARVDPAAARLEVIDTLTIRHRPGVPATRPFPLLLSADLRIDRVERVAGDPIRARDESFKPRDFWTDPPYEELEGYERARSIALELEGAAGTWPESMRVVLSYGGTVYDSLRPPRVAYARGFETTSGLIDPRGAFLGGATFWIPTRPDERFTYRCEIVTPSNWQSVSQGGLIRTDTRDGLRASVWDSPQPMEEIYLIAGPYVTRQEKHGDVDVMTYTYQDTGEEICKRYIDGTKRYIDLYENLIGRYPFSKFALVENFWQTGFGMPSFTLLGNQVIRLPFILDTSYGHEILHNWWGNGVFVDYASGNWCEGLTTYGADYLYKEREGPAAARDYRRSTLQGYLDYVSEGEDQPLRLFRQRDDFATQAIGYGKSMMVFHQVRMLLGDSPFWDALRTFYARHLFERASWSDLFAVFSEKAGRDLSGWEEQWLDRAGAPALTLLDHEVRPLSGGACEVEVEIGQAQSRSYDLRVPVRLGWNDPPADSTRVVALTEDRARTLFRAPRAPDWIAVDPDYDVLRRIDPAEIPPAISRTLGADTAIVVIADGLAPDHVEAYRALARQWDEGARIAIVNESQIGGRELGDLPIWFFGLGSVALRHLSSMPQEDCRLPAELPHSDLPRGGRLADGSGEWRIAGAGHPTGREIVLAGGAPPRPWTLLHVPSADRIATIGRKIPHYGKYSYLVFEEGQNVAKGVWEVRTSPLRVNLGVSTQR